IDHIRQVNHLSEDQLKEALKQQGMEYGKYRQQVRSEIEKVQLLNREIRGKVNVTPEDVQRYYEAHKKDYERAGAVKVRQITLRLEPTAPEEISKVVFERAADIRARGERRGLRQARQAEFRGSHRRRRRRSRRGPAVEAAFRVRGIA